jgi:hypothetical protein
MTRAQRDAELVELLDGALRSGDDRALRASLLADSGLPGPRANLRLIDAFADAAGALATSDLVPELESLLDGWAALGPDAAPGDAPIVMLPCAAVAAYGAVGAARPEWVDDELDKLRRAAGDDRWRVREIVAQAVQRLLAVEWGRVFPVLVAWAADDDPLVVRAAVAAVAEPPLLDDPERAADAYELQRVAVDRYAGEPQPRRSGPGRVLRQGLAYTVSVAVAATGDFALLEELASSNDPDLCWIAAQNAKKARLAGWPDELGRVRGVRASG